MVVLLLVTFFRIREMVFFLGFLLLVGQVVHQVQVVVQVQVDRVDHPVLQEQVDLQELLALQDRVGHRVLQVQVDHQDQLGHPELPGLVDQVVLQEQVVLQVLLFIGTEIGI